MCSSPTDANTNLGSDVFGGGLFNLGIATVTRLLVHVESGPRRRIYLVLRRERRGAIDNFGGASLTITGSTFVGNQAISAPGAFGTGGAIENNSGAGGASNPSTILISSSIFLNNLALGGNASNGGAPRQRGSRAP